ncbi:hypothetical protein ACQI4L_26595 [Mycolicibacterium litorale]|uniref:hypothetical protein n=1 Tax=Mycolicibacterium litorale TaxID=758802 RepID=UPI003CF2574B
MTNRILAWLGVGLLTGWVALVLTFGIAVASADTEPGAAPGNTPTAEAPEETKPEDEVGEPEQTEDEVDQLPEQELPDEELPEELPEEELPKEEPAEEPAVEPEVEPEVVEIPDTGESDPAPTETPDTPTEIPTSEPKEPPLEAEPLDEAPLEEALEQPEVETDVLQGESDRLEQAEARVVNAFTESTVEEPEDREDAETQAVAAAAPLTPQRPTLINIVGTLVFNVFDAVVKFFEGPPAVPPGSAVRVERRPLELDCGNGHTVDADWYFPTETEPDKIIYLQHGAFGRAGLYNVTAAELAERNNAIVVAPSITSNFFACDACALGNDPMHAAVAKLFLGEREALTASAQLAGWEGELPERFVIAGHSGGGQLAAGAAGYYTQYASDADDRDLAGVLLLDTSELGGAVERGVRKIPTDIPVYMINAEPAPLNSYGGLEPVLADVRDGFVGVRLAGGVHSDAWRTTNTLAEFVVGVGTGFSKPSNVEAVQVLAQGWITDWFETDPDKPEVGYYGERGDVISVETDAGTASAYVVPGPAPRLTFIDRIVRAALESMTVLNRFSGNCAVDPDVYQHENQPPSTKDSTNKIASSLDGRRLTGQSVGQHVCTD